jgi:hypothetical protein
MENNNLNAESSASQCKRIKVYLESGHSLTGMDALRLFGCWSLPRRICDLKERGMKIKSESIRLDNGKRVTRYSLAQ